jgi:predicted ABC-type transport system involved in lysophospholipase L1 biosynthesis ATPase subunit
VPSLTARENVALVTEISRQPMTPDEALALVGLSERADHFPAELSGGEQQRVAIARAVANRPKLLLADEPTGNLDPHTADRVFAELLDLVHNTGLSAIMATHNMELAARMDRILRLQDGKLVEVRPQAL